VPAAPGAGARTPLAVRASQPTSHKTSRGAAHQTTLRKASLPCEPSRPDAIIWGAVRNAFCAPSRGRADL
jgi:hypothetical protein